MASVCLTFLATDVRARSWPERIVLYYREGKVERREVGFWARKVVTFDAILVQVHASHMLSIGKLRK